MDSKGTQLFCKACGHTWEYSELGELSAVEGKTYFSHIPDWYEWERSEVRKEIEAGTYHFESIVHTCMMPKDKFIPIGKGHLVHDMNGFTLKGRYKDEDYEVTLLAKDHYSVHIEYEYLGKFGDCVDLNTLNDTFYVYPKCEKFSVTKMSLACEELYKYLNNEE
jgi:rubredoxin